MSLHAAVDAGAVTKLLREEGAGGVVHEERCISGISDSFGLILPRFKQRFTFLSQNTGKKLCVMKQLLLQTTKIKLNQMKSLQDKNTPVYTQIKHDINI